MHQLAGVCFYRSRQGQLVTWSTQEFLDLLGARRTLSELRPALREALRGTTASMAPQGPLPPSTTQESLFDEDDTD
ncbi:hypothetical protein ACF07F_35260 [Streptomyces sp. NPDC015237]|uniref:hypothetical protein n=1 Tax=unclassified Streptomyces TaxID=2593676 RepID=UPI0036F644C0